jgi:hypothetical protein
MVVLFPRSFTMSVLRPFLLLFLATTAPAVVTLVLTYYFRVGEDANAVYTSVRLGTALFVTSTGSTVVHLLYGIAVCVLL